MENKATYGGAITPEQMHEAIKSFDVELRDAGTEESPFVYRKLQNVLDLHNQTFHVRHVLHPVGEFVGRR